MHQKTSTNEIIRHHSDTRLSSEKYDDVLQGAWQAVKILIKNSKITVYI